MLNKNNIDDAVVKENINIYDVTINKKYLARSNTNKGLDECWIEEILLVNANHILINRVKDHIETT